MSCGVGWRHSSDPAVLLWLWLWLWLAATAQIQPLAQELPDATDAALKSKSKKKKKKKKEKGKRNRAVWSSVSKSYWKQRSSCQFKSGFVIMQS